MTDRIQSTNRLIKAVWIVALLAMVAMALFPPWAVAPYESEARQSAGYHAIWSAPASVRAAAPPDTALKPIGIDSFQLIIQCFVAAATAMSLTLLMAVFRPVKNPHP